MADDGDLPPDFDLDAFLLAGNELGQGDGPALSELLQKHRDTVRQLSKLNPTHAASAFAGLLTVPELQANGLRLETLVRASLLVAKGKQKPTDTFLRRAFYDLGKGYVGFGEDPPEDVFVGVVRTERGNFRVLEGMWEGGSYYLQRILETVEGMPRGSGYDDLRDQIHALLTLSDLMCAKAGLERHQLGSSLKADRLSPGIAGARAGSAQRVRFSFDELERANLDPLLLAPFLFSPKQRAELGNEPIGSTSLERYPVVRESDNVILAMPTAVSSAIRYLVVERMIEGGMEAALASGIAKAYAEHLGNMQLLGGRLRAPVTFDFTDCGGFAGVVIEVDDGRFLNFIFVADALQDLETTRLAGFTPHADEISEAIRLHVERAHQGVSAKKGFVDGISLVVGCGIGRGLMAALPTDDFPNWRVATLSAYDLETLSWLPDFKPLSLWRLLDSEDTVAGFGTQLQNINGLLNMVGWTRMLGGHLVPHGDLPDGFAGMVMINQTSQRDLRHQVAIRTDPRVVEYVTGKWVRVRRDQQSDFADDQAAPLYASENRNQDGFISSVYLAEKRAWWGEVVLPGNIPGQFAYERWRILTVWLARAAQLLDGLLQASPRPVRWRAKFDDVALDRRQRPELLTYEQARQAITISIDPALQTVTTTVSASFEDALSHPENIAERALVDAMIEGFLDLAGSDQQQRPELLALIVQGPLARQAHGMPAQNFRDHVRSSLPRRIVRIDKEDDTALRLGLGWKVRKPADGSVINGKEDTTLFLSQLVTMLEDELCAEVALFEKEVLLKKLLRNHEAAAFDRERWKRTAAAVLALHEDKSATLQTMANHEFGLNAVFQASRVLIEIAVCEAPLGVGRVVGELDLSRLMAKAILIFTIGGWSDAIRWEVMEPFLRITPLGDVHAKFDYMDTIVLPHARETSDARFEDAADTYPKWLEPPEPRSSIDDALDPAFLAAWQEEFGTSLQDMRVLVDWLESRGIEHDKAVMTMRRSDFLNVEAAGYALSDATVATLLDRLMLPVRARWREVPEGFLERDRFPWRFRRRLSIMRRPILSMGVGDEERLLIAPGLLRDAFVYTVANYHRGDFPPDQLTKPMRKWAGAQADKRGEAFGHDIAQVLRKQGWQVETEIKLTKILNTGLERDYGDVDVLAWDHSSGRVLIIECKDVQFRKTLGEIGEQLADFKGGYRGNGKPDYLRRHLDRVELLKERLTGLQKFTKLDKDVRVESHVVFKNPVPMRYALSKLASQVTVSTEADVISWPSLPIS